MFIVMVNPAYQCLSSLPIKAIFIISTIVGSIQSNTHGKI